MKYIKIPNNDSEVKMKKILSLALAAVMIFAAVAVLSSCNKEKTYEIGVVTDLGQLADKGFNRGIYDGAMAYAEMNRKTYKLYSPANRADAGDDDRIAAMDQAIANGAKIVVVCGYDQDKALREVAGKNPDTKFIFIGGEDTGLDNVVSVSFREEESGYLAGYAAVAEGYTYLGFTGGGGGVNPDCNRFGFGYVQGAAAASKALGRDVKIKYSYKYGESFETSDELCAQISGWYDDGCEVVFACGGAMFDSVNKAALAHDDAKIIGVDVDQSGESDRVITSAAKGISEAVQYVLARYYDGKWAELGRVVTLGASDGATGLPTETFSQRMKTWTLDEYRELFASVQSGEIGISADVPADAQSGDWLDGWLGENGYTNVTVMFE